MIARESAVFAATVTSTGGIGFDPVELNNFVSAVVANLTIDNVLSESKLLSLAETFRGFSPSQLASRGLPTVEARSSSGRTALPPRRPLTTPSFDNCSHSGRSLPTRR